MILSKQNSAQRRIERARRADAGGTETACAKKVRPALVRLLVRKLTTGPENKAALNESRPQPLGFSIPSRPPVCGRLRGGARPVAGVSAFRRCAAGSLA